MTIRVSGPPHRRSITCATSATVASPTANGASKNSPSWRCRKGSCTSSACSCRCARSLAATCGSWRVDGAEELIELGIEAARVRRIEHPGHGRGTNGSHGLYLGPARRLVKKFQHAAESALDRLAAHGLTVAREVAALAARRTAPEGP